MKTIRLTRAESAAYAAGERRFWRAMRKQPDSPVHQDCVTGQWNQIWYTLDERRDPTIEHCESLICPYGTTGDDIVLMQPSFNSATVSITAITVFQRGGKWGWLVEVGA
jgi:hypothetical protein